MVNYPFGELSIPENLVVTSAYSVRPSVRTLFWGDGRESGASPSGGEYVINRAKYFSRVFLGGKLRKKWSGQVVAFKNLFTLFSSILIIMTLVLSF